MTFGERGWRARGSGRLLCAGRPAECFPHCGIVFIIVTASPTRHLLCYECEQSPCLWFGARACVAGRDGRGWDSKINSRYFLKAAFLHAELCVEPIHWHSVRCHSSPRHNMVGESVADDKSKTLLLLHPGAPPLPPSHHHRLQQPEIIIERY